jgi:phosphatidylglycerophosphate synthase
MIDRHALRLLKPVIDWSAARLYAMGCNADQVTIGGFALGVLGAGAIAIGHPLPALVLILMSRAMDGLDGALARLCGTTDRGAFLDIALDFLFYGSVPLAFAIADPAANALAASVLLAAFVGTGATFLAFAVVAEKRGLKSTDYPTKSIYYLGGLTEGAETFACFAAMCLWPAHFALFAYIYAALCLLTTLTRLAAGWTTFR